VPLQTAAQMLFHYDAVVRDISERRGMRMVGTMNG
jgi:hypothetical protein